jgi:pimeloyl-ACP methyl ester carboxylesterase
LLSEIFVPGFLDDFHLPLLCILLILNLHYQVFLVGHDWGSNIGWEVCRLRPDRIIAYVAVSVPFNVRAPDNSGINKAVAILGEGFYWNRFQVSSGGSILSSFLQIFREHGGTCSESQTLHNTFIVHFLYINQGSKKACLFICFLDTFNKED